MTFLISHLKNEHRLLPEPPQRMTTSILDPENILTYLLHGSFMQLIEIQRVNALFSPKYNILICNTVERQTDLATQVGKKNENNKGLQICIYKATFYLWCPGVSMMWHNWSSKGSHQTLLKNMLPSRIALVNKIYNMGSSQFNNMGSSYSFWTTICLEWYRFSYLSRRLD